MEGIPVEEIDYPLSHPNEYDGEGLTTFLIVGLCIVWGAVALRFHARRMFEVPLRSDDWTLAVGLVSIPPDRTP